MTLITPRSVHIKKPEAALGTFMNSIRMWLDQRKIEPAEFRSGPTEPGVVALDIRFKSDDEAELFEQTFA